LRRYHEVSLRDRHPAPKELDVLKHVPDEIGKVVIDPAR
jgi:hypothetical protein